MVLHAVASPGFSGLVGARLISTDRSSPLVSFLSHTLFFLFPFLTANLPPSFVSFSLFPFHSLSSLTQNAAVVSECALYILRQANVPVASRRFFFCADNKTIYLHPENDRVEFYIVCRNFLSFKNLPTFRQLLNLLVAEPAYGCQPDDRLLLTVPGFSTPEGS